MRKFTMEDFLGMMGAAVAILVFIAIMAMWNSVKADTLDLTWVQPTARVDGTLMPLSEIAGYSLNWTVKGVAQPAKTVPPGTSYTLDTGTLIGKTCVTLATVDTDGLVSDPAGPVCKNAKPNPPSALAVKK